MYKLWLSLISFIIVPTVLAGCSNPTSSNTVGITLNQEFTLSPGQSAEIKGQNLNLTFEKVNEDSRCPTGVTCIWAGRVVCLLRISDNSSPSELSLIEMGGSDEFTQSTFNRYLINFHVQPYPESGKTIAPNEYRLIMKIALAAQS